MSELREEPSRESCNTDVRRDVCALRSSTRDDVVMESCHYSEACCDSGFSPHEPTETKTFPGDLSIIMTSSTVQCHAVHHTPWCSYVVPLSTSWLYVRIIGAHSRWL